MYRGHIEVNHYDYRKSFCPLEVLLLEAAWNSVQQHAFLYLGYFTTVMKITVNCWKSLNLNANVLAQSINSEAQNHEKWIFIGNGCEWIYTKNAEYEPKAENIETEALKSGFHLSPITRNAVYFFILTTSGSQNPQVEAIRNEALAQVPSLSLNHDSQLYKNHHQ
ncbi:hypothetical protein TNCV_3118751 [Trichonephila clavipes]|uniref:Uncharacterized protein n=1 Tax=Trichonephila clavipes TaxID=2585209 RepID=A0A8X6W9Q5_TRICX|nr:hypothetical protein TNCV_3118751 [Trichonephila clavipes]